MFSLRATLRFVVTARFPAVPVARLSFVAARRSEAGTAADEAERLRKTLSIGPESDPFFIVKSGSADPAIAKDLVTLGGEANLLNIVMRHSEDAQIVAAAFLSAYHAVEYFESHKEPLPDTAGPPLRIFGSSAEAIQLVVSVAAHHSRHPVGPRARDVPGLATALLAQIAEQGPSQAEQVVDAAAVGCIANWRHTFDEAVNPLRRSEYRWAERNLLLSLSQYPLLRRPLLRGPLTAVAEMLTAPKDELGVEHVVPAFTILERLARSHAEIGDHLLPALSTGRILRATAQVFQRAMNVSPDAEVWRTAGLKFLTQLTDPSVSAELRALVYDAKFGASQTALNSLLLSTAEASHSGTREERGSDTREGALVGLRFIANVLMEDAIKGRTTELHGALLHFPIACVMQAGTRDVTLLAPALRCLSLIPAYLQKHNIYHSYANAVFYHPMFRHPRVRTVILDALLARAPVTRDMACDAMSIVSLWPAVLNVPGEWVPPARAQIFEGVLRAVEADLAARDTAAGVQNMGEKVNATETKGFLALRGAEILKAFWKVEQTGHLLGPTSVFSSQPEILARLERTLARCKALRDTKAANDMAAASQ